MTMDRRSSSDIQPAQYDEGQPGKRSDQPVAQEIRADQRIGGSIAAPCDGRYGPRQRRERNDDEGDQQQRLEPRPICPSERSV